MISKIIPMKNKWLYIIIFSCSLLFNGRVILQAQTIGPLYFFWGDGCPHCAQEKIFLQELQNEHPNIELKDFEVYHNQKNLDLLVEIGKQTGADVRGVPLLVVGDQIIIGYFDDITTGKQIHDAVDVCLATGCADIVQPIIQSTSGISPPKSESEPSTDPEVSHSPPDPETTPKEFVEPIKDSLSGDIAVGMATDSAAISAEPLADMKIHRELPATINVPVIGEIITASISLPVLTVLLGALDGFNPCAMWTLVFLISLLLGMRDRRRMWILGLAFIAASASVYYIFMAAWLNLILFLGFILWIRLLIALVALGGGAYNIKEFFVNKEGTCKVTGTERRQKVFAGLKEIANRRSFWLALAGIVALAFVVNLVELVCSAGLPAVYTQILAMNNLPAWQYYLYILLYIVVFMLDDMFVFVLAMVTLKMTGLSTKYSRFSHLVGGALMVIIGLLLMFKPEWLMFG